jgi:hypothetical protein
MNTRHKNVCDKSLGIRLAFFHQYVNLSYGYMQFPLNDLLSLKNNTPVRKYVIIFF